MRPSSSYISSRLKVSNNQNNPAIVPIPDNVKNNEELSAIFTNGSTPGDSVLETNFGVLTEELDSTLLTCQPLTITSNDDWNLEFNRSLMYGFGMTAIETSMAIRESFLGEESVKKPYYWTTSKQLRDAFTSYEKQKIFIAFMAEKSSNAVARACMNLNYYEERLDSYSFADAILPVMTADGLLNNTLITDNFYQYIQNVSCFSTDGITNKIIGAHNMSIAQTRDHSYNTNSFLLIGNDKNLNTVNHCMQTCVYSIANNIDEENYVKKKCA